MIRTRSLALAAPGLALALVLAACVVSHTGVPCEVSECRGNTAVSCVAYFSDTALGSSVHGYARDCPSGTTCTMVTGVAENGSWSAETTKDDLAPRCVSDAPDTCAVEGELTCGPDETPKTCAALPDGSLVLVDGVRCPSGSTCLLIIDPPSQHNAQTEIRSTSCVAPAPTPCPEDRSTFSCDGDVLVACYVGRTELVMTDCAATENGSTCVANDAGGAGCAPPPEP